MNSDLAERKRQAQEDRNFTSDRISDLSRYIAFGILGSIFVLLSDKGTIAKNMLGPYKLWTLLTVINGIFAIFSDYFQYLAGYFSSKKAGNRGDFSYETNWWSYRLRKCFFGFKQIATGAAGVTFVILVVLAMSLT